MKIRLLSIVLALEIALTSLVPFAALGDETNTEVTEPTTSATSGTSQEDAQNTLEKQKAELEENLKQTEEKLAELEKNSKLTIEYIDALDQKIGFMNEQLTLLEEENRGVQAEIDKLTPQIEANEKKLNEVSQQVDEAKAELEKLETKFQNVYDAYCMRLRVMYISGDYNIISALLSCKDVSSFLTRYEMIKSVSKSDTELLQEVQEQTIIIVTQKDGLDEKLNEYTSIKADYDAMVGELVEKQNIIEQNSQTIANSKVTLANDRAESDALLAQLTSQNQQYTEFRNEDQALIQAVENEVQDLIAGIKSPDEVTTANRSDYTGATNNTTPSGKAEVFYNSDAVLNMTYPVPGHYSVSAGFPYYSSGGWHGGIDFPCGTGSKVVAAQDGIVITVKRLNYSYGYYVMIYHGTDSKGRSVVTLYAHNSSILVGVGDTVKRGQQIASSGSTGNSTGPHCHFEVRFDGKQNNPTYYLSR